MPDAALGTDQGGRYLLVLDKNNVVEQRKVAIGPKVGDLRVVESGLKAEDRVVVAGILRAIPGRKVDPQLETVAATPATTALCCKKHNPRSPIFSSTGPFWRTCSPS